MTYEVDTDSRNVGFGVGVIGESQEKTRLSNTGITDEEKLEEVVVSRRVGGQLLVVGSLENMSQLGLGLRPETRGRSLIERHG